MPKSEAPPNFALACRLPRPRATLEQGGTTKQPASTQRESYSPFDLFNAHQISLAKASKHGHTCLQHALTCFQGCLLAHEELNPSAGFCCEVLACFQRE